MNISKRILPVVLGSALGLALQSANGANDTWSGGSTTDNNWNTPANWAANAVPANADNLTFYGTNRQANTNNISNLTVGWMTFSNGGFNLSGNALTVAPGTALGVFTNLSGTNTIANNFTLPPAGKYWAISQGSELRLTGTMTNTSPSGTATGWLFLTNGGTVRLMGTNQSTRGMDLFQGTVIIDGGFVDCSTDGIRFKVGSNQVVTTVITNNGTWRVGGGGNFRMGDTGSQGGSLSQLFISSGTLELYNPAGTLFVSDRAAQPSVVTQTGGLVWGSGGNGTSVTFGNAASPSGTYNLNGGTLWVGQVRQVNSGANIFNFNGGTLKPTGSTTTFMQGIDNVYIQSGGAIIDTTNLNVTIAQNLSAGSGSSGGLVKLGSGTLTLSGANTYTGATVVSNGTLALSGSSAINSGSLSVPNGTLSYSFSGTSLNASALSMGAGGTASLNLALVSGNPTVAPIAVNSLSGAGVVTINITAQSLSAGQFPLITFTSGTGLSSFRLGSLPNGVSATLVTTANSIDLKIASAVSVLTWTGAQSSDWDTATANWVNLNSASAKYEELGGFGSMVNFDDSASQLAINLTTTVQPVTMSLNSAYSAYSFRGPGKITGVTSVTQNGWGYTTFGTVNDYTGGTVLNSGYLFAGADQAFGVGPLTLNLGYLASDSEEARTLPNNVFIKADTGIYLGNPTRNGLLTLSGALDFGGANTRTLTFNSDVAIAGTTTNGAFSTKTGLGRMLVTGQARNGVLVNQNNGDVIISGRLDNLDGWRMQCMEYGSTMLFQVNSGGTFTITSATGNFRLGLLNGENTANNVLDVSGLFALSSSGGNGRVDLGQSGASDIVNLRSGGKIACRSITSTSPANTEVNFYGGTLSPIADEPSFMQGLTNVYMQDGGVIIDTTNYNITIGQPLLAAGNGGLTKIGNGTLTLSGGSTYVGPTMVNAGKLVLGSAFAGPSVFTVATNSTLAFLSTGGTAKATVTTLNCAPGAILEAQFTGLSTNSANAAGFINALILNGVTKVNLSGSVTTGQVPLIGFGSITGSGSLVLGQLPHGVVGTLVTNVSAKTIDLVITQVAPLLWSGAVNGNWDTTNLNWTLLGSPSVFSQSDNIRFDDSAVSSTITLNASVSPSGMTISNNSLSYQVTGTGAIGGAMNLIKSGTNTLTIGTANSFVGNITVNAGTLIAANATSMGATGNVVTVTNGGSFDVSGVGQGLRPMVISGPGYRGMGVLVNSAGDQNDAFRNVTLIGDTTVGGSGTIGIRTSADTDPGLVGNGYKLTKVGTNGFNLNGGTTVAGLTNVWMTDIGDIDIKEGTLSFQRRAALGRTNNLITVEPGGTLGLFSLNQTLPAPVNKIVMTNGTIRGNGAGATDTNTLAGQITINGETNLLTTAAVGGSVATTLLYLNGPVVGSGGLTLDGNIFLGGLCTYTGNTLISRGTTTLVGAGQLAGTTNITVASGAILKIANSTPWTLASGQTLGGNGSISGDVTANGTVAIGSSVGTLTFSNNLSLAGKTVMKVTKDGGVACDQIKVGGSIGFGGQLTVILSGSTPLAFNDTFKLFDFTGTPTGSFVITLPVGYTWDTSSLAVNGTIKVAGTPTPPIIDTVEFINGSFTVRGSGGTSGANYSIVTSTDIGLPMSSWTPVVTNAFDGSGKFTTVLPVATSQGNRFYRVKLQ